MTPAAIIRSAAEDGVTVALSPAGTIKAAGDKDALSRWSSAIRENKGGIISLLREMQLLLSTKEEAAIRAWLAYIGETDPESTAETIERCRTNPEARMYFLRRATEASGAESKQQVCP